jgi:putative endonuclease
MTVFLYIIYSNSKDRYYVGHSDNLLRRIPEHNAARCKATKFGVPWTLVFSKSFNSRAEAMKEEYRIKRMKSRKFIERLIASG